MEAARLQEVVKRALEYEKALREKQAANKNVDLSVYKKEVMPFDLLVAEQDAAIKKFADKFLKAFPSFEAEEGEGMFEQASAGAGEGNPPEKLAAKAKGKGKKGK